MPRPVADAHVEEDVAPRGRERAQHVDARGGRERAHDARVRERLRHDAVGENARGRRKRQRSGGEKDEDEQPPHKKGGEGGKGKGSKGRGGKGDGKGSKAKLVTRTPDGRPICFKCNNGEPCDGGCGTAPVCQWPGCGQAHPVHVNHKLR